MDIQKLIQQKLEESERKNLNLLQIVKDSILDEVKEMLENIDYSELIEQQTLPPIIIEGDLGPKGDQGEPGKDGKDGIDGIDGKDGKDGIDGIDGKDGVDGKDGKPGPKGDKGDPGKDGKDGVDGKDGKPGPKGDKGDPGKDGKNGRDGTDGKDGKDGVDGKDGKDGADGKNGIDGKDGKQGPKGEKGDRGLDGKDGVDGKDGKDGVDGKDGKDGKDAVVPDIKPHLDKVTKDFNNWRENVNKSLASLGGGGSYRILDNADVKMSRASEMSENDILIWDTSIQKFKKLNIVTVINNIRAELDMKYDKLVDDAAPYVYIGEAAPGSLANEAKWRIKRVYEDNNGDLEIRYANAQGETFTLIWDNRASYTYI